MMTDDSDSVRAARLRRRRDAAARPRLESPSDDVERPAAAVRIPGAPRDGYTTLPTNPVVIDPVLTGPVADEPSRTTEWEPSAVEVEPAAKARIAPWALTAAILALCVSFFVGWGIPIAIVAVVAAIMSLRRPIESRSMARWALVLGLCAMFYSLGWLVWAGMQFERLG